MFEIFTYRKPINYVIVLNLLAYLIMFCNLKPYKVETLAFGLGIIIMICITYFIILKSNLGDEYLFLIVCMLISLGIIMIYRLDNNTGVKQAIWTAIGIVLFFVTCMIFRLIKIWDGLAVYYIALSVSLYLITLLLGTNINGATNWIVIGGQSFQPLEISKILYILFLACYFKNPDQLFFRDSKFDEVKRLRLNKFILVLFTFVNIFFLMLQKEWGSILLISLVYIIVLYVFGKDRIFFLCNILMTIPVGLFGYYFVYHIRVRIDTWLNPWKDIAGKGYQITQSLFAIYSGGYFGTGLGLGRPDMVPAVNTDFIFSAICEEMGILTGVAVILLYMLLTYRGLKIVMKVKSKFNQVLGLGITTMLGLQTFIIIGGVIKLIPLTGITLPYISYGGSSLISSFIILGILQAISKEDYIDLDGGVDEGE
ncbi:FtsW/RodA/SpoVE family cell cycle protein [Acetivibrio clariflavus]|uniref:Bacterial cell division membrane protein n=1 Tax=Acetivibrio clariflavus (strain DSM 19732 / NBRC 101661 / EBR45) TaxID=720554 RepID=G8LWV1_ACECE|nr:FtsW/RodA/SpoVE family cell cycle protein [Acetivibrio clariflavus]AEV69812.1 bacterial cell division membrane protein [Acetivibrio clariflavus DSM 19732]